MPYSPQQNGIAERKNRSLQEMAICMLADAGMDKLYWGEAVMTAAYIQNRLPSRVINKTPYELWTGRKPDLAQLKVFGCDAYVQVPETKRSKLDQKSVKLTFVGYCEDRKGYRFVDRSNNRVTVSRDAKFLELGDGSEQPVAPEKLTAVDDGATDEIDIPVNFEGGEDPEPMQEDASEGEMSDDSDGWDDANEDVLEYPSGDEEVAAEQEELEPRRQERRTRGVRPRKYDDYIVGMVKSTAEEPTDYHSALKIPAWKQAMDAEMDSHERNATWELVRLPEGKKTIGSRWVFKLKRNEHGDVVKHKARLVAQGFNQRYGVDYLDVFAPVTRHETLRALLAVASKRGFGLRHLDVRTAYLHGTVQEEIYMRQPPGYIVSGQEEQVCRIRKSIYGLKQSARCWNRALHAVLTKLGFRQCQSDSCLYVRDNDDGLVLLLVYVDDILVACLNDAIAKKVYEALRKDLDISDLGTAKHFLGYEIIYEAGVYSLRLTCFIESLIEKFGLSDCKPSKTPMEPEYLKSNGDSKLFEDVSRYRSLVGALLYIAVNARPDVAASVSLLGRRVSGPSEMDWKAAKRVVRYLKGTKELKLQFGPGDGWSLVAYSDADWAGDQESRKSTTGFVFFFGGGPVAWVSRRQASVSLSSMEAEYLALSETCQELIWLRRLMADLGEPQQEATMVHEDNQSCLSFVNLEKTNKRSKHIDTKQHFIKDLCDRGEVKLVYCPSEKMTADVLTKPLGAAKFQGFLECLGLSSK